MVIILIMMTSVYKIAAVIKAMRSVVSGHQLPFQAKKESHQYVLFDSIFFILFKNNSRMYILWNISTKLA